MNITIALAARLPAAQYGGIERVVYWLAKALSIAGHRVTLLCLPGSSAPFCEVMPYDPKQPLAVQIPESTDVLHLHSEHDIPEGIPVCISHHGNNREARTMHPNTVFCSADQARRHNGTVYVHHGLDPDDYPAPDLSADFGNLTFLANAAWRVKNVRGAIRIANLARKRMDVLGGHRLNFRMGFRLTLDPSIRFHGLVDNTAKGEALRKSAGLVFPVLWHEPFGVAVIEALYFGTPVFATPFGSLPELVPPQAGLLSASYAELAEAAANRSYSRAAIHDWWRSSFTLHHMAEGYLPLYRQIADGMPLHPAPIAAPATRDALLFPMRD